jgi:hypothetical protein
MLNANVPPSEEKAQKAKPSRFLPFVLGLILTHIEFALLGLSAGLFLGGLNDQARTVLFTVLGLQAVALVPIFWGIRALWKRSNG